MRFTQFFLYLIQVDSVPVHINLMMCLPVFRLNWNLTKKIIKNCSACLIKAE